MPAADISSNLSSKTVPPIFPPCPTCAEEMRLISVTPTCESVIYGYMCDNDGDRLIWQPRHHIRRKSALRPPRRSEAHRSPATGAELPMR
jgi:hypothetical protein